MQKSRRNNRRDFHAVIPALVYASQNNLNVVYDAHEYTTEAIFDYSETEVEIFTELENRCIKMHSE